MSNESPLFILYGSATGNAESIAKDLASKYESNPSLLPSPFTNVLCCEGNLFKKKCLPIWEKDPSSNTTKKYGVIIVMSTTGNGDAPENGSRFVRYIKKKQTIESLPMKHVAYSVLALGDTNYDKFCASGELVDRKMKECGGERVRKISKADEGTGMEDVVDEFVDNVVRQMAEYCLKKLAAGDDDNDDNAATNVNGDVIGGVNGGSESKEEMKEEKNESTKGKDEIPVETNADLSNGTANGTNGHEKQEVNTSIPKDVLSFNGVNLLQKLLSSSQQQQQNQDIPTVDPKSIPSIGSSLATFEFLPDDYNTQNDTTNTSITAEMDRMTVSSASSSNIHYTLNHPYESTILSARYLTKTKVDGVKKAMDCLNDNGEYHTNLQNAMNRIQSEFPICTSSSVDNHNKNDTTKIIDQNGKRVIEMKLSLPDDFTLEYQPGDSIGLVASNSTNASQLVLSLLSKHHNIRPTQYVSLSGKPPMTVETLICDHVDLCSPIKNKRMLVSLAKYATDENEIKALNFLASSESSSQSLFKTLIEEQRLCFVDILQLFPSCQSIPLDGLVGILPRIPPRYYSICSSPLREEEQSSLTIAFSVVDYMTPQLQIEGHPQRRVGGLVTTYLEAICSSMILSNDNKTTISTSSFIIPKVKIFPKPTADFRLPSSLSTPMILIGPGTGIAPFIGFLEHRQSQITAKNNGSSRASISVAEGTWRGGFDLEEEVEEVGRTSNTMEKKIHGDIDLYFGCRYSDHDWLYEDEMKSFQSKNVLNSLELAFSRDDVKRKCYVQDKIEENASRLASMIINDKAVIYICGDGNAMAKDVQNGIQKALDTYVSNDDKVKGVTVEQLKESGRLLMDIWS